LLTAIKSGVVGHILSHRLRDCLDDVLTGLIVDMNLAPTAAKPRTARVLNGLLLSVRAWECWLDTRCLVRAP
jgi:hypothetical protein